jgi:DNA-binding CsgD family transcriptional regulator
MGVFDFFRRKRKTPVRKRKSVPLQTSKIDEITRKHDIRFQQINRDLADIRILLDRHEGQIIEYGHLIEGHTTKLASLEQRLSNTQPASVPQELPLPSRPIVPSNLSLNQQPAPQRHNIESFSPQEKRILSLFFENPGMALSYLDIAKVLNKSANTVKNQMHQLGMKADLFERMIDNENRNRFKLKEGLKVDRFLNVN